jgi:hypothetical protein
MYKIKRENGSVAVVDWNGKVIYNVAEDYLVMFQKSGAPVQVVSAGKLSDAELLEALASPIKISLD